MHPQAEQFNFRTFFAVRRRSGAELQLVVLDRLLKATTKKGVNFFEEKKCTPIQNPGYAYAVNLKEAEK